MTPTDKMQLEPARVNEEEHENNRDERLRLIGLILAPYVKVQPEDKCGERFDLLYEKSLSELKIYYQVFK